MGKNYFCVCRKSKFWQSSLRWPSWTCPTSHPKFYGFNNVILSTVDSSAAYFDFHSETSHILRGVTWLLWSFHISWYLQNKANRNIWLASGKNLQWIKKYHIRESFYICKQLTLDAKTSQQGSLCNKQHQWMYEGEEHSNSRVNIDYHHLENKQETIQ